MVEELVRANPFVGLRPFKSSESEFFFGREGQTKRLLNKLHHTNFVAVVGSSGSGKSSLVKAGLIPAVKAGFLNKSDRWYIASFRPGDNPLFYLAKSLNKAFNFSDDPEALESAVKQEGSEEIIDRVSPYLLDKESSLLILVDQFEEIFTHFKKITDQSALMYRFEFVKILLELLQSELPIYVILTMRSDFIGRCNMFYGLPEALSDSQFLVPRLQTHELIRVIENPVRLFNNNLEPRLTQKILNDLGDGEDQLPVLQHALSQLWRVKKHELLLTEEDYIATGKLKNALSNHADSIYYSLVNDNAALAPVIKGLFKFIIDFDGENKEGVRQPRKVKEIQLVTGASLQDVKTIFQAFRAEGASFLYSPSGSKLAEDSTIDISHESLMREWALFRMWKEEEEKDKLTLERLNDFAKEFKEGKRGTLTGPEIENYVSWEKYLHYKNPSNRDKIKNWANRYLIDFKEIYKYIKQSKEKALFRKILISSLIIFPLLGIAAFIIYQQDQKIKLQDSKIIVEKANNHAAQMEKRAALVEKQKDALKLRQLSSESEAQANLYKYIRENERLERQNASLNSLLMTRSSIALTNNESSDKYRVFENQILELRRDNEIAELKIREANSRIQSLSREISAYQNISNEVLVTGQFNDPLVAKIDETGKYDAKYFEVSDLNILKDFKIDFKIKSVRRSGSVRYGIAFNFSENLQNHNFTLFSLQPQVSLQPQGGGNAFVSIASGTDFSSKGKYYSKETSIHGKNEFDILSIEKKADFLNFYLNNELLWKTPNLNIQTNSFGLWVGDQSEAALISYTLKQAR